MDPELKKLLEETKALAKDNHDILRAMRRDQWIGFIGKVIVWVIVLLLPLYLYQQYLEPVVSKFYPGSEGAPSGAQGFMGLPTAAEIEKLIQSYKTGNK